MFLDVGDVHDIKLKYTRRHLNDQVVDREVWKLEKVSEGRNLYYREWCKGEISNLCIRGVRGFSFSRKGDDNNQPLSTSSWENPDGKWRYKVEPLFTINESTVWLFFLWEAGNNLRSCYLESREAANHQGAAEEAATTGMNLDVGKKLRCGERSIRRWVLVQYQEEYYDHFSYRGRKQSRSCKSS